MEVITGDADWDLAEDRQLWHLFLETRTGKRLFPKVLETVPALLQAGDQNAILIRSGVVLGWQQAVRALLSLSVPEPEVPETQLSPAYPNLADDSQWDGPKINETKPQG